MKRSLLLVLVVLAALLPGSALAQSADDSQDDVLMRFNGPLTVAAGQEVSTIIVINGDVTIDGVVREALIVVNGTATITGQVRGEMTIWNSTLTLRDGARTEHIGLYRSTLNQDAGATTGTVDEIGLRVNRGFGVWLWISGTVGLLAVGLLFAAVGGRQLAGAALTEGRHAGSTALSALVLVVALPVLAVIALVTVVGIPLGLAIFFLAIPALWLAGYIVSGTALGALILRRYPALAEGEHPYLAVTVGLLVLQLISIVPLLGGLAWLLAGTAGAGALAYRSLTALRGPRATSRPAPMPI